MNPSISDESTTGLQDRALVKRKIITYDDASEFVNPIGGAYLALGGQDVQPIDGTLAAKEDGRGFWFNHSPNFYWNDSNLKNGVRLHSHVTHDFLTGKI